MHVAGGDVLCFDLERKEINSFIFSYLFGRLQLLAPGYACAGRARANGKRVFIGPRSWPCLTGPVVGAMQVCVRVL